MADMKRVDGFLKSRVGTFGISSIILGVLETLMDKVFVCPCQPGYNEGICACYALVPFFACFIFTLRFVDPKPGGRGMQSNSTCNKILYALLIAMIWIFFFFFDDEYVACACSRWTGEYTETGPLKWCKPPGNETLMFEIQEETQRYINISHFVGYGVMVVIVSILGILSCCRNQQKTVQQNGDVPLSDQDNGQRH